MILACHQPNFIPRLDYFDKINKADIFILMIHCQFEKNGYQNRCNVADNWWTNPVIKGNVEIKNKVYANGSELVTTNLAWINAICMTLGIDTSKIKIDFATKAKATERIIELCKFYDCDQYLANPSATTKYLDEQKMNENAIELKPHLFPYKKSIFEAFNELGIEGCQKLLEKQKKLCEA